MLTIMLFEYKSIKFMKCLDSTAFCSYNIIMHVAHIADNVVLNCVATVIYNMFVFYKIFSVIEANLLVLSLKEFGLIQ